MDRDTQWRDPSPNNTPWNPKFQIKDFDYSNNDISLINKR